MKIETVVQRGVVREGYQILLRADARLSLPTEYAHICEFYLNLAKTCMTWAQQIYGESLKKEFLGLESVQERSRFSSRHYQLSGSLVWEEENYAAFLCESMLTGQWKEPQKSYHRISHVWNIAEQTILPFDEILGRFGIRLSKEKLPFRPDGIYPLGEEMVFFRNVTDQSPFLEHRLPRFLEKNEK